MRSPDEGSIARSELLSLRNNLEKEKHMLDEQLSDRREELAGLKDRIGTVEEELAGRRRIADQAQENTLAKMALNDVLEEVVTELMQGCTGVRAGKRPNDDVAGKTMYKTVSKLLDTLSQRSTTKHSSNGASHGKILCVEMISHEQASEKQVCKVYVTPEMCFEELTKIVHLYWSLDEDDPKTEYLLVDEAGTNFPSNANVFDEICCGVSEPYLLLNSSSRFEFSSIHQQIIRQAEEIDERQENVAIAPILGPYAQKQHDKRLKKEDEHELPLGEDVPSAAASTTKYVDPVIRGQARCMLDVILITALLVAMIVFIVWDNVGVEHSIYQTLLAELEAPVSITLSGSLTFMNISTWSELVAFIEEPLVNWLTTLSGPNSRNRIVMPVRIRQNRVIASAYNGSECPPLTINLQVEHCFPDYKPSLEAIKFYQGQPGLQKALESATLPAEAAKAFEYQSNSWGIKEKWSYPAPDAPDISTQNGYPSGGFLLELPLVTNATAGDNPVDLTPLHVLQSLNFSWLDRQTRYVTLEVSFYNANYGGWGTARLVIETNTRGILHTELQSNVLIGLNTNTPTLLALCAVAFAVVLYLIYALYAYFAMIRKKCHDMRTKDESHKEKAQLVGRKRFGSTNRSTSWCMIFTYCFTDVWFLLDFALAVLVSFATSYMIIPRFCQRYDKVTIPSMRYVEMYHLANMSSYSRILAAHAICCIVVRFLRYFQNARPYVSLETGTIYYSFKSLVHLLLMFILLILGTSISIFLLRTASGSYDPSMLNLIQVVLETENYLYGNPVDVTHVGSVVEITVFILYVFLVYLILIKIAIAICYQGRVIVSTERMRFSKVDASGSEETWRYLMDMLQKKWEDMKIGKPSLQ
mmetsp:Transcript_5090/g.7749  ORF Transcript_5090/g.7749 Transcript_5090/m.7749 type:complete len:868 (-) Transcript_5090:835-3438(-)